MEQSLNKKEIVNQYIPIIQKIANSYFNYNTDPVEDLVQVGVIGLLEALSRYKKEYMTSFKTYAIHFINGYIRHYIRDKQPLIKGGRQVQELAYKIREVVKKFVVEKGIEPSDNEIAEVLKISVKEVIQAKLYENEISLIWLDHEIFNKDDSEISLLDKLAHPYSHDIANEIENRIVIQEALQRLPLLEKRILELKYFKDLTQNEIAQYLGISQMEVSRRLKKAEIQLKRILKDVV